MPEKIISDSIENATVIKYLVELLVFFATALWSILTYRVLNSASKKDIEAINESIVILFEKLDAMKDEKIEDLKEKADELKKELTRERKRRKKDK